MNNPFKSDLLNKVLDYELENGNFVYTRETAWSAKDLVIRLEFPLNKDYCEELAAQNPKEIHTFEIKDNQNIKTYGIATKEEAIAAPLVNPDF